MDIFGSSDVAADAELVACAVDMMRGFGLTSTDVVVRVSDRRMLHALLESLEALVGVHRTTFQSGRGGDSNLLGDRLTRHPSETGMPNSARR